MVPRSGNSVAGRTIHHRHGRPGHGVSAIAQGNASVRAVFHCRTSGSDAARSAEPWRRCPANVRTVLPIACAGIQRSAKNGYRVRCAAGPMRLQHRKRTALGVRGYEFRSEIVHLWHRHCVSLTPDTRRAVSPGPPAIQHGISPNSSTNRRPIAAGFFFCSSFVGSRGGYPDIVPRFRGKVGGARHLRISY